MVLPFYGLLGFALRAYNFLIYMHYMPMTTRRYPFGGLATSVSISSLQFSAFDMQKLLGLDPGASHTTLRIGGSGTKKVVSPAIVSRSKL